MFKRCRFVPSVLIVEMEILKSFSCVVTCEFFRSSKYNVQKKSYMQYEVNMCYIFKWKPQIQNFILF